MQKTIVPMVEGVREQNATLELVDPTTFEQGLADLRATGGPGGTFCYTFFRVPGGGQAGVTVSAIPGHLSTGLPVTR